MIKVAIKKINKELNDNYLYSLLIITFVISIIKINFLPISLPIDSYGYINFADNLFLKNDWQSRPIGYPFFLKITRLIDYFGFIFTIFFQIILYIFSCSLLYLTFKKFNKLVAFIFSIIFLLTPSFQWINYNLVADSLYAFLPIIVIFFIFQFFDNKSNSNIFFIFLFALITALMRPTYLVFFYLFVINTIFFYFLIKKYNYFQINFSFIIKSLIISFLCIFTFNSIGSKFSKNYGVHQLWLWNVSTSICGTEKCFNINNGKHAEKYFDVVSKLIDSDNYFKEVLSSNYDYKDSAESLNEKLYSLESEELLNTIHKSQKHTPFVHIYGFMVNNLGFDETHKIIRNLSIETFLKNPKILISNLKKIYNYNSLLNTNIKKSTQVFKEGIYFAVLPKPYSSLEEQGMTFLENISFKEYSQMIYSLEKFTGNTITNYSKNKHKFNELHNKIDDFDFVVNKFQSDNNYAFIFFYMLGYLNLYFLIFYKLFILIIIPVYSIVFIFNKIIFKKISSQCYVYFLSLMLFYSIFILSAIIAPIDIDRVINLNLSIFFPLLIIFFINISKLTLNR